MSAVDLADAAKAIGGLALLAVLWFGGEGLLVRYVLPGVERVQAWKDVRTRAATYGAHRAPAGARTNIIGDSTSPLPVQAKR